MLRKQKEALMPLMEALLEAKFSYSRILQILLQLSLLPPEQEKNLLLQELVKSQLPLELEKEKEKRQLLLMILRLQRKIMMMP